MTPATALSTPTTSRHPAPIPSTSTVPYCECGHPALATSIILARGAPCKQWGCGNLGGCEFFQIDKNPVPIPLIPQKRPSSEYVKTNLILAGNLVSPIFRRILRSRRLRTGYANVMTSPNSQKPIPEGNSGVVPMRNVPLWNGTKIWGRSLERILSALEYGPGRLMSVSGYVVSGQVPSPYDSQPPQCNQTGHWASGDCFRTHILDLLFTVVFQTARMLPAQVNQSARRVPPLVVKPEVVIGVVKKVTGQTVRCSLGYSMQLLLIKKKPVLILKERKTRNHGQRPEQRQHPSEEVRLPDPRRDHVREEGRVLEGRRLLVNLLLRTNGSVYRVYCVFIL